MVLHWMEGFEVDGTATYLNAKYASVASTPSTSTPGRSGSGRYATGTGSVLTTRSFGVTNTWTVGFGSYLASNGALQSVRFINGATEQFRIETTTSGAGFVWRALRGANVLATGTTVLPVGTWAYIEVQVTVRTGTNGSVQLRINEVTEFNTASLNTANLGSDGADVVAFALGTGAGHRMDDIYVVDSTGSENNDFLGDSIVHGILPATDGATTTWSTSSGTNHAALVDDPATASDDNDRILSDTTGNLDLFNMASLPTITGAIRGIQVNVRSAMASAGTRDIRAIYRDPAGPSLHDLGPADETVNGTTHQSKPFVSGVNPSTSAPWTETDINGGQFGVEVVA